MARPRFDLPPLPAQPADVPWPAADWPVGSLSDAVADPVHALVDEMFDDAEGFGTTYAVVVVHRGKLVFERYGNSLPKWDLPDEPVERDTPLLSWSMAKSILHAAVGVLVGAGRLTLDGPAPVEEWADPLDPRHAITLEDLLAMRDGLDFTEDYVDADVSDVMDMLFGSGQADVSGYAARRLMAHRPGECFNYSSGTSNIVARVVATAVGIGADYDAFLHDAVFDPIGMHTATARFDDAGIFIGSSYVYAQARDFARFGLLYLRDGTWDGRRVLPEGWVDHGRRFRSVDPTDGRFYGAHWWVVDDDLGTFWASGYEGQSMVCCPGLDLVVARFGRSTDAQYPALAAWRAAMVDAFRP